jgi:hypothetical protein
MPDLASHAVRAMDEMTADNYPRPDARADRDVHHGVSACGRSQPGLAERAGPPIVVNEDGDLKHLGNPRADRHVMPPLVGRMEYQPQVAV